MVTWIGIQNSSRNLKIYCLPPRVYPIFSIRKMCLLFWEYPCQFFRISQNTGGFILLTSYIYDIFLQKLICPREEQIFHYENLRIYVSLVMLAESFLWLKVPKTLPSNLVWADCSLCQVPVHACIFQFPQGPNVFFQKTMGEYSYLMIVVGN